MIFAFGSQISDIGSQKLPVCSQHLDVSKHKLLKRSSRHPVLSVDGSQKLPVGSQRLNASQWFWL